LRRGRTDEADETVKGTTIENLALPSPFGQRAYDKAVEFDEMLASGPLDQARLDPVVRDYTGVVRDNLWHFPFPWRTIEFSWPRNWYIPAAANYNDYWPFVEPPSENRFSHQWKTETYNTALSATGDLGAFKRLLSPNDRFTMSEAGIGFLYRPSFSYGVVSLRPDVDCTSHFRRWQGLE